MVAETAKISPTETALIFIRSVSCSKAMLTVLDRALDHPLSIEERGAHPLSGGLLQHGYQCGMMWGATLAAGAEAYRLFGPGPQAQSAAIGVAQKLAESFSARTGSVDCRDMTKADFLSATGGLKYMLTGKAVGCTLLCVKWTPEAIEIINNALSTKQLDAPAPPVSCSALMAEKMGATDMQTVMAAGFAGGIGLGGGACGALSTAIWLTAMQWFRDNSDATDGFIRNIRREATRKLDFYPQVRAVAQKFLKVTDNKWKCSEIVGKRFDNVADHAAFLRDGGCSKILSFTE